MAMRVPAVGTKPVRKQPLRCSNNTDSNATSYITPQATQARPAVDKREECAQVLRLGLVQSFVDLFYLIHRIETKGKRL